MESGLTISGFAAEFARCVRTEAVPGKKKLLIQIYPDTCGRGLRISKFGSPNLLLYSTKLLRNILLLTTDHSSVIIAVFFLVMYKLLHVKRYRQTKDRLIFVPIVPNPAFLTNLF